MGLWKQISPHLLIAVDQKRPFDKQALFFLKKKMRLEDDDGLAVFDD